MAKINLRQYLNGIEELIDSGQIEESLAHCRHILKIYPKHVNTYRMMGKAYLEAKRHGEASDIFQRVLSSSPDDFVAHIGMSIIREDEGNQNAAIWHMERAFEAQPSNRAVQDELRRLYGEREGFEPPKVRLTRGALARMYAHGDLYAQAISELRSALNEDPQRPDLQVLLARMYYLTRRNADAIEVCTRLLEKLPYCLYANHLMADILAKGEHPGEAENYLARVEELDPYAAQISIQEMADSVPADSVMVEHLVLSGAAPRTESAPRSWTGALEPIDEPESYIPEELPDWLSAGEEQAEPEDPEDMEEAQPEHLPDEPVPAFELESEDEEEELPESPPELTTEPQAVEQQEIPDWLRELQPGEEAAVGKPPEDRAASDTQPVWEQEFDDAGFEPTPMPEEEPAAEAEAEPAALMATDEDAGEDQDDGLAWLEGLAAKQGAGEDELITEPEEREEDKPDWLKSPEEKAEEAADSLAWLDEMAAEVGEAPEPAIESDEGLDPGLEAEEPAPMESEAELEAAPSAPAFREAGEEDEDAIPDWLKDLGDEAAQNRVTTELDQSALDQPPDWLDELRPRTHELEGGKTAEEAAEEAWESEGEQAGDLSTLDWLEELGEPQRAPGEAAEQPRASAWVPEKQLEGAPEVTEEPEEPAAAPRAEVAEPELEPPPEPISSQQLQHEERLQAAREALNAGDLDAALEGYGKLTRSRKLLGEVIADLESALSHHDQNISLWQTLGDAYMRSDRLRDALNCYTKAEDLL